MFTEEDDPKPDDGRPSPPGKILSFPGRPAPDWLTGPADGLGAALDPLDDATDEAPPESLPQPVLRRPGAPAPLPELVPAIDQAIAKPAPDAEKLAKEPASPPAPSRRLAPPGIWAPVASSVPVLRLALPDGPEPVESASTVAPPPRVLGLPGRNEDLLRTAAAPPPLAPLHEPWWVIALDSVRTRRPVQIGVAAGLVALVLVAWWSWPRGVGTISLSELRSYPARYDGRTVVVRGRVGDDIFAVGAGWAFYLVQGRDTIVTFTRSQRPNPRAVITVKGQVSTGFLDGVPRQALFEDTAAPQ